MSDVKAKEVLGDGSLKNPFQTKLMWCKENPQTKKKEFYVANGGGGAGGDSQVPADQIEFITDGSQADGNVKKIFIVS